MPSTATDFKLINTNQQFEQQFNKTLDYYRAFDPGAEAKLQQGLAMGIQVMYNPPGNPLLPTSITGGIDITGQDMMVIYNDKPTILYNPDSALMVTDGHGRVQGIESPSSGFIHEFDGHALHGDSDWLLHEVGDAASYQFFNERIAVNAEDVFNALAGEPLRDNHGGTEVFVNDPTAHTITTEDGALQLVRMGADGKLEYGPQIDYKSAGWQHIEHLFDATQTYRADNSSGTKTIVSDSDASATDPVTVSGHQTGGNADGWYLLHDINGIPYLVHVSDPPKEDPVVITDPQSSGGSSAYEPWESGWPGSDGGGSETGPEVACVAIASYLPDGRRAGEMKVGDSMELADQHTLERGSGVVRYSQEKSVPGYRIITESGAALVCSNSAPIPVKSRGLMTPDQLPGEEVAVRRDKDGIVGVRWEKVVVAEAVGRISVQHITVGDKCFWAGEEKGAYILHHNSKPTGSGSSADGEGGSAGSDPAEVVGVHQFAAGILM